jgi:hypothetical protein
MLEWTMDPDIDSRTDSRMDSMMYSQPNNGWNFTSGRSPAMLESMSRDSEMDSRADSRLAEGMDSRAKWGTENGKWRIVDPFAY